MIIIPTYNEKSNIRQLVDRIRKVNQNIPILFIDDNSPDGTSLEINELKKTDPLVSLITRPGKLGFASAYLTGFKFVLESTTADYIITMDADLSHPPEVLPQMLKALETHDWVVGSRYTKGGGVKNWGVIRRILSRFANLYARVLMRIPLNDLTSGNVGFKRDFLKSFSQSDVKCQGYASLMELKSLAYRHSRNFCEIPIIFEERKKGVSKINLKIILEGVKFPLKFFWQKYLVNYKTLFGLLVFLLSFGVYIKTLPHQIYVGDSPEFAGVIETLGIAHPPGYPTYVLLAKIFTFLSFGSPEFQIGIFSSLAASAGLVIFYMVFLKILEIFRCSLRKNIQYLLAIGIALLLAFSDIFWSQAIMIKPYSLLFFFFILIFWLLLNFLQSQKPKFMLWAVFLLGLGAGVHFIILLFLPLFGIVLLPWFKDKILSEGFWKFQFNGRTALLACLVFLIGLSLFLYLPIRSRFNPGYDFSRMLKTSIPGQNLSSFIDYVQRSQYGGISKTFILKDKVLFFNSFLNNLWQQFYWLLLLAVGGLIYFWRNKLLLFCILSVIGLNAFGVILLRPDRWTTGNEFFFSFYYLPAYAGVALLIGFGLVWLAEKLEKTKLVILVLILSVVLSVVVGFYNYPKNNLSNYSFSNDYTRKVLEVLPKNAVLLLSSNTFATDTLMFGIPYQQIVKGFRTDVSVLIHADIYPELDRKFVNAIFNLKDEKNVRKYLVLYALKAQEYKDRPIFTTFLVNDTKDNWISNSNGIVYALSKQRAVVNQDEIKKIDYQKDLPISEQTMFGRALLSQYFYSQAAFWQGQNNSERALQDLLQAVKYDEEVLSLDYQSFVNYRKN